MMLTLSVNCVLLSTMRNIWSIDLDPLEYGHRLTEDSNLVPVISTELSTPSNFPQPCNCQKCGKANVRNVPKYQKNAFLGHF